MPVITQNGDVTVIVPWRSGCPYRQAAKDVIIDRLERKYPSWSIVIAEYPERFGPWRKGMALSLGGSVDPSSVVVVSDADVVCDDLMLAVDAVRDGSHLWAMPHHDVWRLNQVGTHQAIYDGWWPLQDWSRREMAPYMDVPPYVASPGGGLVVLSGRIFNSIPIDPRFAGWGQEDHSWSLALHRLAGAPMRGRGVLWHLWHPPSPRMRRGVGSQEGLALWHRYRSATTPEAMRALIREAQAETARFAGTLL